MKYILILLILFVSTAHAQTKDPCQPLRDSVTKYQRNIRVWKSRISPMNDPGYNILLNDKIKSLEATKRKFVQLVKKCK